MEADSQDSGRQVNFRSGYVAIIGAPNVGKSTLLNELLGEKVAITTPKPQTTRRQVRGILTGNNFQVVFVDTPGIHSSQGLLNKMLVRWATQALDDVDAALFVVDVTRRRRSREFAILELLKRVRLPVILVLNKIDRVAKETLLPIIDEFRDMYHFEAVVPVSARYGKGVNLVLDEVLRLLAEGPRFYDGAIITDQTTEEIVTELIREKIFLLAEQEIPYSTAVVCDHIRSDPEKNRVDVFAVIFVERASQKGIIIGKGGRFIKKIRQLVEKELKHLWGRRVRLTLWVKVLKNWSKDEKAISRLGLTT
ncbi:MAG TPA: GTPase Era [Thermodesulfobacteriaceae bacterium]|nr:GTPase Era [Thermodesulfobacteriaceae bacterium]